jgi:hypothetical protein
MCTPSSQQSITDRMKTFTEAQSEVIKQIKSEPADNGMHYQWIMTKTHYAQEMTEESMKEILKTNPKGLTDESAKYGVAQLIQFNMKKK